MGERLRRRQPGWSWEGRVFEGGVWVWRSTGAKDKTAARAILRTWERRAADPALAAEATATLDGLLRDYLASRRARGRAAATLDYYRAKAGHLVRLLPGLAADLTHAALEAYVAQRRAEGAASAAAKELGLLRSALRLARRSGLFARDPATVLPELEPTYRPRERRLAPEELLGLALALPPARAAHVVWIVATGSRWGESLRARAEDVADGLVRVRGTKTATSAASVPVLPSTVHLLAWALERAARPGTGRLFAAWGNVRRDLAAACRTLGVLPVTPNDLRRTFGSWLRVGGAEISLVGAALRHADSRMAERVYARLTPHELGAALGRHVPPASHAGAGEGSLGRLLAARHPGKPAESVPRDGIEPPTRGFSIQQSGPELTVFRGLLRGRVPPVHHGAWAGELAAYAWAERVEAGELPN